MAALERNATSRPVSGIAPLNLVEDVDVAFAFKALKHGMDLGEGSLVHPKLLG
jgi:hypothetical protein